jgi:hypothetical protein
MEYQVYQAHDLMPHSFVSSEGVGRAMCSVTREWQPCPSFHLSKVPLLPPIRHAKHFPSLSLETGDFKGAS